MWLVPDPNRPHGAALTDLDATVLVDQGNRIVGYSYHHGIANSKPPQFEETHWMLEPLDGPKLPIGHAYWYGIGRAFGWIGNAKLFSERMPLGPIYQSSKEWEGDVLKILAPEKGKGCMVSARSVTWTQAAYPASFTGKTGGRMAEFDKVDGERPASCWYHPPSKLIAAWVRTTPDPLRHPLAGVDYDEHSGTSISTTTSFNAWSKDVPEDNGAIRLHGTLAWQRFQVVNEGNGPVIKAT